MGFFPTWLSNSPIHCNQPTHILIGDKKYSFTLVSRDRIYMYWYLEYHGYVEMIGTTNYTQVFYLDISNPLVSRRFFSFLYARSSRLQSLTSMFYNILWQFGFVYFQFTYWFCVLSVHLLVRWPTVHGWEPLVPTTS